MQVVSCRRVLPLTTIFLLTVAATIGAQVQGVTVSGRLFHSVSLKPLGNALVQVEGTKLETRSRDDGSYSIPNVPQGSHHLLIAAPGFVPARVELVVGQAPVTRDVAVDPELHYTEVVSVSPDARSQFDSYQPTSVLAGQDLAKYLEGTVGATLAVQPGVAERSFGPGPSRPVIRGLDGDRVLILDDGVRVGDLSSQSADHGVVVNPASSSRIEVVRGPATLLYGANAIGGLVNVISDTIPTARIDGASGGMSFDLGSAAAELGGAADVRWGNNQFALHASGSGRRSGDVDSPEGEIANTQSRGGFGSIGAAWTGGRSYVGGSYGYDDTRYGLPYVEDGQVELTPRRHTLGARAGADQLHGFFSSYRALFGYRHYRHEEIVAGEVGTEFENDTTDLNIQAKHQPWGRLTGTVGGSLLLRTFSSTGEEALSPPVEENNFALFLYEELIWPHVTVQFGGRINTASFSPEGGLPDRDFTDGSGSVGLVIRPAAADDRLTLAFSLARAARNPALEELYFFGPHPGNFAFEIGNSNLESERALGFDASIRWRHRRASGELTYFRNGIDDYIFRNPISEEEFDARFPHGEGEGNEHGHGEFPIVEFIARDSLLQGLEAHADVELGAGLLAEIGFDLVRGQLRDSGDPLPRIPPTRFRLGLRYQRNALQAGGEWVSAARQDRVFGEETPTDGYNLLRLHTAYSFGRGRTVNTITVRLDNATNELYRNHLSYVKDFVPEMGRNFRVIYSVRF
ncbi:MAG TPA: TonB-dependent receptor [Vicinamibacterales bacterium]|nr:TonB-dependent receptor [Vicinamibacterales bacterium]